MLHYYVISHRVVYHPSVDNIIAGGKTQILNGKHICIEVISLDRLFDFCPSNPTRISYDIDFQFARQFYLFISRVMAAGISY